MKIFSAALGATILLSSVATVASTRNPSNDKCRGAKVIPVASLPYLETVNFSAYPRSQRGTSPSCANVTKEIWYEFTPPVDGILTVYTIDFVERYFSKPGVNIGLAASTGSCTNQTEVKCWDYGGTGFEVFYPIVQAGQTYKIQVADIGNVGTGLVNITFAFKPSNLEVRGDECADATVIPHASLPFNEIIDTRLYSNNVLDVVNSCGYGDDGNNVWYKYRPMFDGLMIVDTRGSIMDIPYATRFFGFANLDLDVTLGVFAGQCKNLSQVFCANEQEADTLFYPVKRGVTYTIKVAQSWYYGLGPTNFTLSFQRNYFNVLTKGKQIAVLNDLYNGEYEDSYNKLNVINYGLINTADLEIEAIFTNRNSIRSVSLQLENQEKSNCVNSKPFQMVGEARQKDVPFAIGNRIITATAFSNPNCTGKVIDKVSEDFIVRGCENVHYELYDAKRNVYRTTINNASMFSSPPCQVNVGVALSCGFVPRSVRLELRKASNNDLVVSRDDAQAPYLLFGENSRDNITSGSIPAGEYLLTAIINNIVHPSVRFTMGACNQASNGVDKTFDIDLRFDFTQDYAITYDVAKLFTPVVKRISSLVIGDRPDYTNISALAPDYFCGQYPPRIDDLFICTSVLNYDDGESGFLGSLVRSYARPGDKLPISGTILFDRTFFTTALQNGKAESYILQQLIRTLGLGEYWDNFHLANTLPPCRYNGTKAKAEFRKITGCSSDIPLEQETLPKIDGVGDYEYDCKFWDPNCLKNEVLTYTLGEKKISRITLGALEDLGYVVNYTAADPYGIEDIGVCAGCNRNLKSPSTGSYDTSKQSTTTSCHSGVVHERVIHRGRKMLRDIYDHHMEQIKHTPVPEGVTFVGNQLITMMYEHESGALCSVDVRNDDLF